MNEIFIGEYIKAARKRKGLGQKELCEGICEPVTISRLENGKQTPSRKIINALLQRLDLPADRYFALLNEQETRLENLQEEIVALNIRFQNSADADRTSVREQVFQKLVELDKLAGPGDQITRQFILRSKVMLGREDGSTYAFEEQLNLLLEAIRMTVPKFSLNKIGSFLYCLDEIKVINQIAGVFTRRGQHAEAAEIYGQLLSYLQNHCQNVLQYKGHLPMIAHNYARVLNLCGQNEKALEVAELARQACIDFKNYQFMPRILHVMAVTYHDMGLHRESRRSYRQAYYLCQAIDDEKNAAPLRADAVRQYQMQFED